MIRILISLFVGGLGGTALGFALGIFIYPFWFLNDIATEQLQANSPRVLIASGEFIQANPSDPIHWGKGTVELFKESNGSIVVYLDKDFEVGPGPRFNVYLVDSDTILSSDDFQAAKSVDLGRLRAFKGSQVYPVSSEIDVSVYKSVVIWCKDFEVLISPAPLVLSNTAAATSIPSEG